MNVCPLIYSEPLAETGWDVVHVTLHGVTVHTHVVPCGDLRLHQLDPGCWCDPVEDDEKADLYGHNSADGRENFEQGAKPN